MSKNKSFLAIVLLSLSFAASAQPTVVAGPLEVVAVAEGKLTVLGQTLSVDGATRLATSGKAVLGKRLLALLPVGGFLIVEAVEKSGRLTAESIHVSDIGYVPGATATYVSGRVVSISRSTGVIQIGQLPIDISAVPFEIASQIRVGEFLEVLGTQPLPGGSLVNAEVLSVGSLETLAVVDLVQQSFGGTSTSSVGGSGIESIGGSGIESIGGSGLESIGGSGIESIGGSGIESIGGSGLESIGGSGLESIGGSGLESIGGSGLESIGGSGLESIGGSGLESIGGSGLESIGGSGLESIGGSGLESIGGSGLLSVGGSGMLSVGGSGSY